jgi:pimeloyl-ACP methyl ester carboxylesterase
VTEELQIRSFGNPALPTLIYLPGLHGDWTLISSFRAALKERVHFVEMTYPRSLTWSINDYADEIERALLERGITHGWLLGESFGSQLAWPLLEGNSAVTQKNHFRVDGIILAGGFVKHPWQWGPGVLRWIGRMTPMPLFRLELKLYAMYARFRHRKAPETLASIAEFVSRRTRQDREAMQARLKLLNGYDPRPVLCHANVPIYYLAGLVDPLVPWMLVRRWLSKNCPSYRGGKTFWLADHNVLATAPTKAAEQILEWMHDRKE